MKTEIINQISDTEREVWTFLFRIAYNGIPHAYFKSVALQKHISADWHFAFYKWADWLPNNPKPEIPQSIIKEAKESFCQMIMQMEVE